MSLSSNANQVANDFAAFKIAHGKAYENLEEETYRLGVFMNNAKFIQQNNDLNEGAMLGYTKFADLTEEEFRA